MATESVHMDVCPEYSRVRETELEGVQPRGLGIWTPRAGSVRTRGPVLSNFNLPGLVSTSVMVMK